MTRVCAGLVILLLGCPITGEGRLALAQESDPAFQPGIADEAARHAQETGDIWRSKPVRHPESGSYFQFVRDLRPNGQGVEWRQAATSAQAERYLDRPGRLAVIQSRAQYQWLMSRFPPNESSKIWIGLRYFCANRRLVWASGQTHDASGFSAWDRPWHRAGSERCGTQPQLPYMGVYIDPASHRWRATGYRKRFRHYIIEYPAPANSQRPRTDEQPGDPRA
ncbi:C-type lectin domain-containing protein [Rhodothalassium salexigens]|uniref:C-type lectin domain-containing protein n=1 Tax=Rhodothalassium salexigens TaxID=1086 RepID=UPI0019121F37|nr:C-type lectin domain-containing protein [Rhodothalassium salexigens]